MSLVRWKSPEPSDTMRHAEARQPAAGHREAEAVDRGLLEQTRVLEAQLVLIHRRDDRPDSTARRADRRRSPRTRRPCRACGRWCSATAIRRAARRSASCAAAGAAIHVSAATSAGGSHPCRAVHGALLADHRELAADDVQGCPVGFSFDQRDVAAAGDHARPCRSCRPTRTRSGPACRPDAPRSKRAAQHQVAAQREDRERHRRRCRRACRRWWCPAAADGTDWDSWTRSRPRRWDRRTRSAGRSPRRASPTSRGS